MRALKAKRRAPKLIVLENVLGLLATNAGDDFQSVVVALSGIGYRVGALVVDARHFVPQSRPRLFIIGIADRLPIPSEIKSRGPSTPWHPDRLIKVWRNLPLRARRKWIWLDPGKAPKTPKRLADVVSDRPVDVDWHTAAQTRRLVGLMSPIHRRKLRAAKLTGARMVATLFLRMRPERGVNRQCAEISFSDVAGCVRTPRGRGSRPRIVVVHGAEVRSRLLSPREAATLMGLDKAYALPESYEAAFQVIGDGLAVPAVRFIRDRILKPVLVETRTVSRRRKRRTKRRLPPWTTRSIHRSGERLVEHAS
jgi:DNA (cytosine-5)-methyltransferase 1